ncbi:MAG: SurA N-terminal domain-containing protein [Deltaproteobacteria bacterium]|nr:SurA N-terminal domain-containing protein [Deltaproteobacteria bacterium]
MNEISGIHNDRPCPNCGEGNDRQNAYCVRCGRSLQKGRRRGKTWIVLFVLIGLAHIGVAGYFITGGFKSKLVGRVNGEEITRKEFSNRLDRAKKLYEFRFGKDFFKGTAGEENFIRLKAQLLEEVVMEKLLLQEAKSGGYANVPEKEIDEQIEAIKKNHGLSEADFKNKLGVGLLEFKEELKKDWLISQFVEKAVLKGSQDNREQLFQEWLTAAKSRGKVETYEKFDAPPPIQSVCCKGGGCAGGEKVRSLDPKVEKEARAKALQYYEAQKGKNGASARVINFGCHIQVDIIEEGKVVLSLTFDRGEVKEI